MVLRHVAQPQLGFKSLLWWYHSNQTHLKELFRVWCCTVSTPRTPAISCFPSHLFSLQAISIPGMTHQSPPPPVYKRALCGLQPAMRWESAPASTVMDIRESGTSSKTNKTPSLCDYCAWTEWFSEAEGWRGQLLSESGNLTACGVIYGERLFLEILAHPLSH